MREKPPVKREEKISPPIGSEFSREKLPVFRDEKGTIVGSPVPSSIPAPYHYCPRCGVRLCPCTQH